MPPFPFHWDMYFGWENPYSFFFFPQMRFSSFSFPNEVVFAKYPIAQHATPPDPTQAQELKPGSGAEKRAPRGLVPQTAVQATAVPGWPIRS